MDSSEQELEDLLSRNPDLLNKQAHRGFDQAADGSASLVLFGAGNLGRDCLAGLRKVGIEPIAFADDTPTKWGKVIDGLPVFSVSESAERFGQAHAFIVTICNAGHQYLQTKSRLRGLDCERVMPFLALALKYPEVFLPYFQFDLPGKTLAQAPSIRRAFRLLGNEWSRQQFVSHLKFRLLLDFDTLPANSPIKYFTNKVASRLTDEAVFVDCGAFDGDTIRMFIDRRGKSFKKIVGIEPDPANFQKLTEYVSELDSEINSKIKLLNIAAGSRKSIERFNSSGSEGSFIDSGGAIEVSLDLLDDVLDGLEPTFIKFDIEGAEQDALIGTRNIIESFKPVMAVCVYHRLDDLWQVPLYLHSINGDYNLYLETEGEDGFGTVCYAIPPMLGRQL